MTNSIAFATAFALPLRSTISRKCSVTRRIPVAMRVIGGPERSKDETKEEESESPFVGGVIPPNDFEDDDTKNVIDTDSDAKGVAGIAEENDFLSDLKPPVDTGPNQADVIEAATEELALSGKDKRQNENKPKIPDAAKTSKTTESREKPPEVVTTDKKTAPSEEDTKDLKTSVRMTPEQVGKAKAAREAAVKAAEEQEAKKAEKGKEVLAKAEDILTKLGNKSRAFELGESARAKAEVFVENTISEGQKEEAAQQEKLKGSAASAAKAVVTTITKGWEETVAPKIRESLPSEYREISNKALASAAVGLFVAIALLPSLFSGGQQKPTEVAKKKIDSETAMLEKKLQRDRSVTSPYSSRSASQKAVFPPEEKLGTVATPPKSAPSEQKAEKPAPKVPEIPRQAPPSLPSTSLSSTPKPEAAAPPAVTKPVEPVKPKETQPPKPVEVTPGIIMTSVSKALGPNAGLVTSASFDTLSPQPTILLEVTKAYHNLPINKQKNLAQVMLQSARGLGYERVSLIEMGTGVEVAHAGLEVELEDETENLRAQVGSLQKLSDKLAMQNAGKEVEIDALNRRISEERDEFALEKAQLEKSIKTLREENSGLIDDLTDAKAEISKMPDRMALEERTLQAEQRSEKMSDTVEMLSMQLSKARNEEVLAKKSQADSIEAANQAVKEKDQALASVAGEIERAQEAAESRADERIATVERDSQRSVEDANKKVREIEERLERTLEESKASVEQTKKSYEKQLSDQKDSNEKEVQTIQSKYESMLEDVQRRAHTELDAFQKEADRRMSIAMKEAKSFANSLTKERDDALKEVQKVQKQGQKAVDKAEREKQTLQKRIERLETKLSKKAASAVQEEQPAEVETPSNR